VCRLFWACMSCISPPFQCFSSYHDHLPLSSSPQGRALDLVPVARCNYTLWTEKAEGSNNIFSGGRKKRSDRKQTWSPLSENATLDFDFVVPKGVRGSGVGREAGVVVCLLRLQWKNNDQTSFKPTYSLLPPPLPPSLPPRRARCVC